MGTTPKIICVDPGHGNWNKKRGVYDPGACSGSQSEATIVMVWANCLREILMARGIKVIRTRIDAQDPAPVSRRDDIARAYDCDRMISLHCNAATGKAQGTETFYRGDDDKALAGKLNQAVVSALGTIDRGVKTERDSQHTSLAVMEFDKCWLVELGFIDHLGDQAKVLNQELMRKACEALAEVLLS